MQLPFAVIFIAMVLLAHDPRRVDGFTTTKRATSARLSYGGLRVISSSSAGADGINDAVSGRNFLRSHASSVTRCSSNRGSNGLRRTTMLMMSESAPEWSACRVLKNTQDAIGLRVIDVEVPPTIAALYSDPGQYVKIKTGDNKPSFMAIASPPDGRTIFSFLIKGTENNDYLYSAKEGDSLDLSVPQGRGFQIEEYFTKYKNDFPTTNIMLMACGSGIAPIAAAIESDKLGLRKTPYTSIFETRATLYLGARTPKHLPFQSKYNEWAEAGVLVVPVISQVAAPESEGWTGRTGYVQDALKEDKVKVPRNSGALLCGVKGMVDNVKELLMEAGVFEGRVLLNF